MLTYALKTYMKFDHQSGIDIECSTLKTELQRIVNMDQIQNTEYIRFLKI